MVSPPKMTGKMAGKAVLAALAMKAEGAKAEIKAPTDQASESKAAEDSKSNLAESKDGSSSLDVATAELTIDTDFVEVQSTHFSCIT